MAYYRQGCLGNYDFEHIASHAKRRFVDGQDTVTLLQQAASEREREEIALVCMMDIEDQQILDLELRCRHAERCHVTDCRERLQSMIEGMLADTRY